MKQYFALFFLFSAAAACLAGAERELVAFEDFNRLDPGEYVRGKTVWRIRKEDGRSILQLESGSDALCGWKFNDARNVNYVLRIRFRLQDSSTAMTFAFHGSQFRKNPPLQYSQYRFHLAKNKAFLLCAITENQRSQNNAANAAPPEKKPEAVLPVSLEANVWYEAEFTVGDESFEASLTYPDGKTVVIMKTDILPGLRIHGLTFSGRADVDWIGAYDFPEKK